MKQISFVKNMQNFDIILISFLFLNLLFLAYIGFFKKDALWLETIKAGGSQNINLVKDIYQHPSYIAQQAEAIKQGLDAFGIK